jgi:hypothetical protein
MKPLRSHNFAFLPILSVLAFLSVIPEGNLLVVSRAYSVDKKGKRRFPEGMTERKAKTDN